MRAPENTRRMCSLEIFESASSWLGRSRATGLRQHREMQTGARAEQKEAAEGGSFQRDSEENERKDERRRVLFGSSMLRAEEQREKKPPWMG